MLYLIGLGIGDEKDISLRGIEACKKAEKVFLELYTCPLKIDISYLENYIALDLFDLEKGATLSP